ncbi:MAG: hypothetical protein M1821_008958 [Bathelium mastoideum]|nr:MAG: hypothetical protein M1821_008958 [Bathelium mastoideum]
MAFSLIEQQLPDLQPYAEFREKLHAHPELSNLESETAKSVGRKLRSFDGYIVHENIGGHGVVAVFENGPGLKVLLRGDMDALPIREQTGLSYASKVTQVDTDGVRKPVMHACGHDIHVACLLATAETLARLRSSWSGTVILVFQPAEEKASGAQAMVDGGLYNRVPIPDMVLAQHVGPTRAGTIGIRPGPMMATGDSFKVTFFGRGSHGAAPEKSIDPIVMASNAVTRLQTIVSREISPGEETAVVTVGSFHAGEAENIIPDKADLRVNVRTFDSKTRDRVIESVKRIIKAESQASGALKEPQVEPISSFPLTSNDSTVVAKLNKTFKNCLGKDFDSDFPKNMASEDFSVLATSVGKPYAFWILGGTDPEKYDEAEKKGTLGTDIPGNHSPFFAPVTQPTLGVGAGVLCAAALTFLGKENGGS